VRQVEEESFFWEGVDDEFEKWGIFGRVGFFVCELGGWGGVGA